jgi:hypothetical protein
MLTLIREPAAIEPDLWFIVFHTRAATPWLNRLPIGRFKHVSAFAYVHGASCWLVCDVQLDCFRQLILPDNARTLDYLAELTEGCAVLHMRKKFGRGPWFRWGFWCVPAMKHLLGLRSSALRPDTLFRDCLRAGAKVIHELRIATSVPGPGRSEPRGADRGGQPGQGGCAAAAAEG